MIIMCINSFCNDPFRIQINQIVCVSIFGCVEFHQFFMFVFSLDFRDLLRGKRKTPNGMRFRQHSFGNGIELSSKQKQLIFLNSYSALENTINALIKHEQANKLQNATKHRMMSNFSTKNRISLVKAN